MKKYGHLTLEEREILYSKREQKISLRKIALELNRSESTISRELRRNARYGRDYIPCHAQRWADRRSERQRYKAPLKNPEIYLFVREHLRDDGWSPELIAGRLGLIHPDKHITKETIYRYIYKRSSRRYKLWRHLTVKRKKRMNLNGRRVRRDGKIPGAISIDERPIEILNRAEIGHWETDNVIGKQSDKSCISSSVERQIRYTILDKLPDKTAESKTVSLERGLLEFPQNLRKTLTADNGKENSYHERISSALKINVYFCHAYHSWEKGSVENMNGRIRRYIPKGESIDPIEDDEIKYIEYCLNNTPRKCLGFYTPYEKLLEALNK